MAAANILPIQRRNVDEIHQRPFLEENEVGFAWMGPMSRGPSRPRPEPTVKEPAPPPPGPYISPRKLKAIERNTRYAEAKKRYKEKQEAIRAGTWVEPKKEVAAPPPPPPSTPPPQLTETEQMILELRNRILRRQGIDPDAVVEAEVVADEAEMAAAEPQQAVQGAAVGSKPRFGAVTVGRGKPEFAFTVTKEQLDRAAAIATIFLAKKQRIADAKQAKLTANAPKTVKKGPKANDALIANARALAQGQFELPIHDNERAANINRLHYEAIEEKKRLIEERKAKRAEALLAPKVEPVVQREPTPEKPKTPPTVVETLRQRMRSKFGGETEEETDAVDVEEETEPEPERPQLTEEEIRRARAAKLNKQFKDEQQKKLDRINQRRQRSKSVGREDPKAKRVAPVYDLKVAATTEQQERALRINKALEDALEQRRQKKAIKTGSLDSKKKPAASKVVVKHEFAADVPDNRRDRAMEIERLNREVQDLMIAKREARREAKAKEKGEQTAAKKGDKPPARREFNDQITEAKLARGLMINQMMEESRPKSKSIGKDRPKKTEPRARTKSAPRASRFENKMDDDKLSRADRINQMHREAKEARRLGLPPPNQQQQQEAVPDPSIPDPTDLSVEGLWRQMHYRKRLQEESRQEEMRLRPEQMGSNPFGVVGGVFPPTPLRPKTPPPRVPIVEEQATEEESAPKTSKKSKYTLPNVHFFILVIIFRIYRRTCNKTAAAWRQDYCPSTTRNAS